MVFKYRLKITVSQANGHSDQYSVAMIVISPVEDGFFAGIVNITCRQDEKKVRILKL